LSMIVALFVGIGAGVLSAVHSRSVIDYVSMLVAIIGVSMPVFWLGILMIIYVAPILDLPRTGFNDQNWATMLASLAMPATALGLLSSATIARLSRSAMLDVLTQDYIRTARSKGLAESVVILKHAMRNAAIPIVTVVGNSFGYLLVGAVLTETVFALPGLGREVVEAIKQRDRELVTGGILLMSFVFVGVNLLVDLSYAWFDPRVRDDRN
ncbi:MAG: ABC transporter permease, partial [Planctomycetes bacterium]|nr:ABC transporter permease [Planctomycetota bacterium]